MQATSCRFGYLSVKANKKVDSLFEHSLIRDLQSNVPDEIHANQWELIEDILKGVKRKKQSAKQSASEHTLVGGEEATRT